MSAAEELTPAVEEALRFVQERVRRRRTPAANDPMPQLSEEAAEALRSWAEERDAAEQRALDEFGAAEAILTKCESKVERNLLVALVDVGSGEPCVDHFTLTATDGSRVVAHPQFSVSGRRIDIAIFADGQSLAIEVDGWEWHESTPALAKATKQRARHLFAAGWTTIPVAAIEVMDDAHAVAREILNLVRRAPF